MASIVLHYPAKAGPQGGSVVAGQATISTTGNVTNIDQSTNRAIINWQGFSIGPQETVNFNQPSSLSATLNRVLGNETSIISGALNANGQVFIINAAGVLFTKNSQVNAGGLVASTLNIPNADFMAGKYTFSGPSMASIVNQGSIRARDGGYVSLLGKKVSNDGVISANLGTVALAAGSKVTLNFGGNSLLNVTVDKGVLNALVQNRRLIKADGGRVILTAKAADAVLSAQVNNSGVIQARTMAALKGGAGTRATVHVGAIKLLASGGTVKVGGRLDASAPKGGNGGRIETSGNKVRVASNAVITTKAAHGKNGNWLIDPDGFTIGPGGDISATTLRNELTSSNVTIASTDGSGTSGNVNVNDALSWAANTRLTLVSTKDIDVNAPVTATGQNAGLALNAGSDIYINAPVSLSGTNAALSLNYGGEYHIQTPASFSGTVTEPDGTLVAKPDTSGGVYGSLTLSGADASLTINGQAYMLIHDMNGLASISSQGYYALAQNIDASGTTYSQPVVNTLIGTLAGLGHTISNLTINTTSASATSEDAALIGTLGDATEAIASSVAENTLRDIGLVNVNAIGATAATLVGMNIGTISDAYANGTVTGQSHVGGLVADNLGTITSSYADVNVTGQNNVGGLVGFNYSSGTISNSDARCVPVSCNPGQWGSVTATANVIQLGGSTSFPAVNESTNIGGLVGVNFGTISASRSSVPVATTNSSSVGGLVGYNVSSLGGPQASITGSTASGSVTATVTNPNVFPQASGGGGIGGLVGTNDGATITGSSFTGNLTASGTAVGAIYNVGGLVGNDFTGTLSNNSSTGSVAANSYVSYVGGLVGNEEGGQLTNNFAGGSVSGGNQTGGFAGTVESGSQLSGNTFSQAATGQAAGIAANGVGNSGLTNTAVVTPPPATPLPPTAAEIAAAAALLQPVLTATSAANVISTTNAALSAAQTPQPSLAAAGAKAVAAIAGPKIDDNIKVDIPTAPAPPAPSPSAEERREHRGGTGAKETTRKAGTGGPGGRAFIRSIDIDGQHFELEDLSKKAPPAEAPAPPSPEAPGEAPAPPSAGAPASAPNEAPGDSPVPPPAEAPAPPPGENNQ